MTDEKFAELGKRINDGCATNLDTKTLFYEVIHLNDVLMSTRMVLERRDNELDRLDSEVRRLRSEIARLKEELKSECNPCYFDSDI